MPHPHQGLPTTPGGKHTQFTQDWDIQSLPKIQHSLPETETYTVLPKIQHSLLKIQHNLPKIDTNSSPKIQHSLPKIQHFLQKIQHSLPKTDTNSLPKIQHSLPKDSTQFTHDSTLKITHQNQNIYHERQL